MALRLIASATQVGTAPPTLSIISIGGVTGPIVFTPSYESEGIYKITASQPVFIAGTPEKYYAANKIDMHSWYLTRQVSPTELIIQTMYDGACQNEILHNSLIELIN